jgi:hypothetical protein
VSGTRRSSSRSSGCSCALRCSTRASATWICCWAPPGAPGRPAARGRRRGWAAATRCAARRAPCAAAPGRASPGCGRGFLARFDGAGLVGAVEAMTGWRFIVDDREVAGRVAALEGGEVDRVDDAAHRDDREDLAVERRGPERGVSHGERQQHGDLAEAAEPQEREPSARALRGEVPAGVRRRRKEDERDRLEAHALRERAGRTCSRATGRPYSPARGCARRRRSRGCASARCSPRCGRRSG